MEGQLSIETFEGHHEEGREGREEAGPEAARPAQGRCRVEPSRPRAGHRPLVRRRSAGLRRREQPRSGRRGV